MVQLHKNNNMSSLPLRLITPTLLGFVLLSGSETVAFQSVHVFSSDPYGCDPKQCIRRRRHQYPYRTTAITKTPSLHSISRPAAPLNNNRTPQNEDPTNNTNNEMKSQHQNDGASVPNLTISLVKSIVGGGVLALPAGVASLGDTMEQALPTALIFIWIMAAVNAYFFSLMGRVCQWTGARTYGEAWEKTCGRHDGSTGSTTASTSSLNSIDDRNGDSPATTTSQAVTLTVTLKTLLSCLVYSMILADSFASLAATAGLEQVIDRTMSLLIVTVTALLPLCLLRDLSSLTGASAAGLAALGVTVVTAVTRYLDGSYSQYNGGGDTFWNDLPANLQPAFGDSNNAFSNISTRVPDVQHGFVLLALLATAFVAHYNAPRFHAELRTKSQFGTVVNVAFGTAAVVFCILAAAGFGTFGTHAQPFLLNNYSANDLYAGASRATLAISILLTYPLPFVGLRDGVLDLFWTTNATQGDDDDGTTITLVTMGLLAVVTGMALVIQDLALVLSVGGGTFSTLVASVFPTLMFRGAVKTRIEKNEQTRGDEQDVILSLVLMVASVAIGTTGVYMSLETALRM